MPRNMQAASTTCSWPHAQATCKGVFPAKFTASTGDRALRNYPKLTQLRVTALKSEIWTKKWEIVLIRYSKIKKILAKARIVVCEGF